MEQGKQHNGTRPRTSCACHAVRLTAIPDVSGRKGAVQRSDAHSRLRRAMPERG